MIETRKNEVRFKTSNFNKALNMWLVSRVLKSWKEDFVEEDTGKVVSIERNEVLIDWCTFVSQDVLAQLKFYQQSGDIPKGYEIEVSNQKRLAYHIENEWQHPYTAKVKFNDNSKRNYLFYSNSIRNSIDLLKDFVELNGKGGFEIIMIKEFEVDKILIDNLKELKIDDNPDASSESVEDDKNNTTDEKKFYQIEANVLTSDFYGNKDSYTKVFVVHTFNTNRAMMIINDYLNKQQEKRAKEAVEKGNTYDKLEISTIIETAKTISISCFIPIEFSNAYL